MKIQHSLSFQFLVLVSLGLLTTNLYAEEDDDAKPSITVTGTAEIRVVPDEAVLTFSVESREEKLDDAVKDNDEKIKAVTDFLSQSKIDPGNIRTQVINIQPIFEQHDDQWKGPVAEMPMPQTDSAAAPERKQKIKPIGYTARRGLSITITDLKSFETIYRGLIERGVNDVGGIEFRTTELRKYRDQARLSAVRAAREKATAMAGELGATLASVQSIAEESGYGSNNYMSQNTFATAVMSDDSGSVAAGMIEINASVRVVFLLGETGLHK